MLIAGFQESSLNEWDGHVSSIIWTPGCNWRCTYCHAGYLILDTDKLELINEAKVFKYIESKSGWIDGLCISGGEPTLQPDLCDFIKKVKDQATVEKLIKDKLLDCYCLDFKQMPDRRLLEITGETGNLYSVLQSFNLAFGAGIEVEFHTTLCPSYIGIDDIPIMGNFLHNAGLWVLQQYDTTNTISPNLAREAKYNQEQLGEILKSAQLVHKNVMMQNI